METGCWLIGYGIIGSIVGTMMLVSGEGLNFYFFSGILCLIIAFFMGKRTINKIDDFTKWLNGIMKSKYGLSRSDIKIEFEENLKKVLIYTKNNELFFGDYDKKSFKRIDIRRILKIEMDQDFSIKNVRRPVALTSTYDTKLTLHSTALKIITDYKTFEIQIDATSEMLDKYERFKLTIENQIEFLNNKKPQLNIEK